MAKNRKQSRSGDKKNVKKQSANRVWLKARSRARRNILERLK